MSNFTIPIYMFGGLIVGGIVGYFQEKYQVPKENGKAEMPNDYDYDQVGTPQPPSKKTILTKKNSSTLKAPPPLNH